MTTMGPTVTINVLIQRYWIWGALGCKLYGMTGAVCGKKNLKIETLNHYGTRRKGTSVTRKNSPNVYKNAQKLFH